MGVGHVGCILDNGNCDKKLGVFLWEARLDIMVRSRFGSARNYGSRVPNAAFT